MGCEPELGGDRHPRRSGSAAGRRMGLPPPDRSLPAGQRCWPPPRGRVCAAAGGAPGTGTAQRRAALPVQSGAAEWPGPVGRLPARRQHRRAPSQPVAAAHAGCELMSQPDPLSPARDHVHKYATISSPTATHLGSRPAEPPPVPAWRPRGWHTLRRQWLSSSRRRNPGLPGLGRCRYRRPGLAHRPAGGAGTELADAGGPAVAGGVCHPHRKQHPCAASGR